MHASSHCLGNLPSSRSLGTKLWGPNMKNVAKFPLDTDCHPACRQEPEVSAEVLLWWHHRFLAVRGDLGEHHTEAMRREGRWERSCPFACGPGAR